MGEYGWVRVVDAMALASGMFDWAAYSGREPFGSAFSGFRRQNNVIPITTRLTKATAPITPPIIAPTLTPEGGDLV